MASPRSQEGSLERRRTGILLFLVLLVTLVWSIISWSLLLFIFILQEATRWTSITGWPPTANHHPPHANRHLFIQGHLRKQKLLVLLSFSPFFMATYLQGTSRHPPKNRSQIADTVYENEFNHPAGQSGQLKHALRGDIFHWMHIGFLLWKL